MGVKCGSSSENDDVILICHFLRLYIEFSTSNPPSHNLEGGWVGAWVSQRTPVHALDPNPNTAKCQRLEINFSPINQNIYSVHTPLCIAIYRNVMWCGNGQMWGQRIDIFSKLDKHAQRFKIKCFENDNYFSKLVYTSINYCIFLFCFLVPH